MLKLPVPELRLGKPMVVNAPCSKDLREIVTSLVERAEALRTGRVDPREDNMLLVTTDGRKAARPHPGRAAAAGAARSPEH